MNSHHFILLFCFIIFGHIQTGLAKVLCDFEPIVFPIKSIDLANSGTARGIAMSLGTPSKEYAFSPQLEVNNTWMYDSDDPLCSNSTSTNYCNAYRGGVFNNAGSSTFSRGVDVVAAGGPSGDNSLINIGSSVGGGSDTIQITSNLSLTHFPIGFPRHDWGNGTYPLNFIGLGSNSTLLSWLKSAGYIGSWTYSIFWGLTGATGTAKMDGSLVLGGYDDGKIQGKKYIKNIGPRGTCGTGMMVEVTDILLNFPNGSNSSIIPSGSINACIVPGYSMVMSLPDKPYYENFERLTKTASFGRSVGINYGGLLYPADAAFKGDITITIGSTLSIRIPNNQLVLPDLILDQDGNDQYNSSDVEVMLNALDGNNPADIPKLGNQFLTSAYLTVSQDAGVFSLWQANPTNYVRLLAIKDPICQGGVNASNNTSNSTKNPSEGNQNSRISKTIIAVATVCSCTAFGLATALAFFLHRSRRRNAVSGKLSYTKDNMDYFTYEMDGFPVKKEMWAGQDVQEMPSNWGRSEPNELPASPIKERH